MVRRDDLASFEAQKDQQIHVAEAAFIHRAKYVMENFLGIHPTPPPPDVKIEEPDVRQAKTIKEIW